MCVCVCVCVSVCLCVVCPCLSVCVDVCVYAVRVMLCCVSMCVHTYIPYTAESFYIFMNFMHLHMLCMHLTNYTSNSKYFLAIN